MRIDRNSVKLLVFVGSDDKTKGDFDALVIIPELNISLTMRQCGQLAPVIVASSGNSEDQRKSPAEYLNQELKRFSEFINNARRSELVEQISSDPNKIFETNSEFKAKRIKQIKEALNSMTQQPERIQVASFSRFTDQINVLLPIKNEMYTMSVLHQSCGNESVAVGRILPLISIKNELKRKVEAYSTTEDIGSRRKPKRKD
jgi:transcriptional regulator of heat shock response